MDFINSSITNNIKDAELTLRNINLSMKSINSYSSHPEEVISAKCDLLLHWIRYYNLELNHIKMSEFAQELLQDHDLLIISNDLRAQVHFLIGLTKFMSEKVSYTDIKEHLKSALIEADNPCLKSLIAHNLAVINYCELQDFNDRVSRGDSFFNSEQLSEDVKKDMKNKADERVSQAQL